MSQEKWIPDGITSVTPHFVRKDAAKAIEFYEKAFGAEVKQRLNTPDGRVMHACLKFGNAAIFICDEFPECGPALEPQTEKNAHVTIHLFVEDVDAAFKRATEAGAKALMPPTDMFWGDRYSRLQDPFGQMWSIATHKEQLSQEQLEKNMAEAMQQMAGAAK
ncbi:VOC family protein [Candidatus Obscuribacterales bacterium]|nr:VOC family protein [Candidatus Obscuribacterales bacterium]MBX3135101.1 VOC family protein [Candidatus Obscuribacterales bacterium]MBX3150918.1 VOC family protein [Candidatus Obscuribacterales bacterium]